MRTETLRDEGTFGINEIIGRKIIKKLPNLVSSPHNMHQRNNCSKLKGKTLKTSVIATGRKLGERGSESKGEKGRERGGERDGGREGGREGKERMGGKRVS